MFSAFPLPPKGPSPLQHDFDDRLSDDPLSFYGITRDDPGLVSRNSVINGIFEDLTPKKVMVICGPPGCGKTSLAQLTMWEAKTRGWTIFPVSARSIQSFDGMTLVTTNLSLDVYELAMSGRDVLIVIDDIQSVYSNCSNIVGTDACRCKKCDVIFALLEWLCRGRRGNIRVLITAVYLFRGLRAAPSPMTGLPRLPMTTIMWTREDAIALIDKVIGMNGNEEEKMSAVRACQEKILSLCETPFGFHIGLVRKMTNIALEAEVGPNLEASVLRALASKKIDLSRFFPLDGLGSCKIGEREKRGLALLLRSPVPISSALLGNQLRRELVHSCVVYDESVFNHRLREGQMVALMSPLARRCVGCAFFKTEPTETFPAVKDLVMATLIKFSSARLQDMIKASPASQRLRLGKEIGIQREFYRSLLQVLPVGCECVPEISDPGKLDK